MFDDFDGFEDQFNDEHDEIAQIQKQADMEQNLYELKDKLVRNNWDMILEKGIDFKAMQENGIEGFPSIIITSASGVKQEDYSGEREVKPICDFYKSKL